MARPPGKLITIFEVTFVGVGLVMTLVDLASVLVDLLSEVVVPPAKVSADVKISKGMCHNIIELDFENQLSSRE